MHFGLRDAFWIKGCILDIGMHFGLSYAFWIKGCNFFQEEDKIVKKNMKKGLADSLPVVTGQAWLPSRRKTKSRSVQKIIKLK